MRQMQCLIGALSAVILLCAGQSEGHGMMLDPPGRSSRWRYDSSAPKNYNDNALYCGGFGVQWHKNNGKCGLCGDDYALPVPRPNEIGGYYGGSGKITKIYNSHTANVGVKITANHLGYMYFNLCDLDEFGAESESCFEKYRLRFADGSERYYVGTTIGWINSTVVLPPGMRCNHCVLRWTYNAGNNWGICANGTAMLGCGPQENFMSCSDIRIYAAGRSRLLTSLVEQTDAVSVEVEAAKHSNGERTTLFSIPYPYSWCSYVKPTG